MVVLDSARCLLACKNEIIYLSPVQNIVLTTIIENQDKTATSKELEQACGEFYTNFRRSITAINKKISKYGKINNRKQKYILEIYKRK